MTAAQLAALVLLAGRPLDSLIVGPLVDMLQIDELAALVSDGRTVRGQVTRPVFAAWCASTGMRAAIEDHATNRDSPLRSIALSLRDVLGGGAQDIDFAWPENVAMLDAWITAGALTRAGADALLALSEHAAPVDRSTIEAGVINLETSTA